MPFDLHCPYQHLLLVSIQMPMCTTTVGIAQASSERQPALSIPDEGSLSMQMRASRCKLELYVLPKGPYPILLLGMLMPTGLYKFVNPVDISQVHLLSSSALCKAQPRVSECHFRQAGASWRWMWPATSKFCQEACRTERRPLCLSQP